MLGWGADYPDASNFLDYHFGAGTGKKFGTPFPDLAAAIDRGRPDGRRRRARAAAYSQANDLIKQHVPVVPDRPRRLRAPPSRPTSRALTPRPLGNEIFSAIKAGDRDTARRGCRTPSRSACTAGRDRRRDAPGLRADQGVAVRLRRWAAPTPVPALATGCTANADLTVWTCTLREGVKFHDGSTLDANDVIVSFAAQWDAASPLHMGSTGAFDYWPALFGGGS